MKPPRHRLLAIGVCAALALGAVWANCAPPIGKLTWEAVFGWIAHTWPEVPPERAVVLYCSVGMRWSKAAAELLRAFRGKSTESTATSQPGVRAIWPGVEPQLRPIRL